MWKRFINNKLDFGNNKEKWTSMAGVFLFIAIGLALFFGIGNTVGRMSHVQQTESRYALSQSITTCDYLLKGGTIIDGTGTAGYVGDVAIKDGKILAVGKFTVANPARVIDITGKVVAPGFIDLHTHTENYWINSPSGKMTLAQGITTHIAGNCGTSVDSVPNYLAKIAKNGSAINVGLFTGYAKLRRQAGVASEARPTEAQLKKMQALLKQSIKGGSFGMSIGLSYAPQNLATMDELKALAKTIKGTNGLFAMHIRNEGNWVIGSLQEAIDIAAVTGVRFEYSHAKAVGENNWSKVPTILKMLDQAKANGVNIMTDVYVYNFSSNDIGSDNYVSNNEENIKMILKHPMAMVASDGGLRGSGIAVHPRAYANATRVLTKYVRDEKVLSLPEAIHKMTQMPAERLNINDRGLLLGSYKADIVVFDLNALKENATRTNPSKLSSGMSYVFVNGVMAIDNGTFTNKKGGVALYSNQYYQQ